jgi:carbonic anhydrase/acetyltransferase-like protein (isoleucine patch superfamily)
MPLAPYLDTAPVLDTGVFIHDSAQVIGDVTLGRDSSVWCNAVLRGDVNRITVGVCSNVQDLTMGHVSHRNPSKPEGSPLVIGDYVTVGHSVILHGCRIGNRVLVGMGTIVLDEVEIGDGAMIGAGSLVTARTKIPAGMLAHGRPCKPIRPVTDEERGRILEASTLYVRYAREHREGTST